MILVALFLVAALTGYLLFPHEPTYEGRSLGTWIEPFCQQTKTGIDAPGGQLNFEKLQPSRRAVAAMGTNALPFLIARLNDRESAIHRSLRLLLKNQKIITYQLDAPQVEYIRAIRALANLGPTAQPAVPALTAQCRDPLLAPHASYALIAIGEEGVKALMQERTNLAPMLRMQIDGGLLDYGVNGEQATNFAGARALTIGLSGIAADPTAFTRAAAINRLAMLGVNASNAVPTLVSILQDPNPALQQMAIHALGSIRVPEEVVIPALTNLVESSDFGVQAAAVTALRRIGYQVDVRRLTPPHPRFVPVNSGPVFP